MTSSIIVMALFEHLEEELIETSTLDLAHK